MKTSSLDERKTKLEITFLLNKKILFNQIIIMLQLVKCWKTPGKKFSLYEREKEICSKHRTYQ